MSLRFLPVLPLAATPGVALVAGGWGNDVGERATAGVLQTPGGTRSASGGPVASGFEPGAADQQVAIGAGAGGAPLSREKQTCTVNAGDVTFVVKNESGTTRRRFTIGGNGVGARSGQFNAGYTDQHTLRDPRPGEYDILCSFHEQAGMRAKRVVE